MLGFTPGALAELKVTFTTEQQTPNDYRQYTYRRSSSFTTVNGVEDAQAKKVLRYTTADQVDVYLNGVKREAGVDYLLCDGTSTSAAPSNTVLFTFTVTGSSNQVDVIVSQAASTSTVDIAFSRMVDNEARVGLGAWEGIDSVTSPVHGTWALFYFDFSTNTSLKTDVKMLFSSMELRNTPADPWIEVPRACILLSRTAVHTQVDRQRAKWIPILNLITNTEYLVIKLVNNERTLMVTESSAVDVFPVLDVVRLRVPTLMTTNLTGDSSAEELDNQIITGPDT